MMGFRLFELGQKLHTKIWPFCLMVVTDLATMMVTGYVSSASTGPERIVLYDGCIISCMSVLTSL